MTKRVSKRWLRRTSIAVMLSTSLLMFGEGGFAATVNGTPSTVVSHAQTLIGKPYKSGANGPTQFDSAGYIAYVLKQAGVKVSDSLPALYKQGEKIAQKDVKPGDVMFFQNKSGTLNFAGIYIGNDRIVYASKSSGKVIEKDLDDVNNSFAGARRYIKSDDSQGSGKQDQSAALADKIIATGEKYMGVPYKFGAEYETSGKFDCSSFVQYVYKQNGIKLPRDSRQQSTVGKTVSMSQIKKGDLVFFKSYGSSSNRITHVAIYAGDNKLLHTYGKPGVTYTKLKGTSWEKRVVTIKRVLP